MIEDSMLVENIRAWSPKERPEGFDALPVIDGYAFALWNGGVIVTGLASYGVAGVPAGNIFETSPVTEIDGEHHEDPPTWVRTKHQYYRLGSPLSIVAPVVLVATSDDWHVAFETARLQTGQHTLDAAAQLALLEIEYQRAHGGDKPYRALRARARDVATALELQGREALVHAWALLAADPADRSAAQDVVDMLEAVEAGDVDGFDDVLKAWRAVGAGKYAIGDDEDPIAGIKKAVRWLKGSGAEHIRDADGNEAGVPPFVKVAGAGSWRDAWTIAGTYLPADLVGEADLRGINSWMGAVRLKVAREMKMLAMERKDKDAAHMFALLSTPAGDAREIDWISWKLRVVADLTDRNSAGARAYRAWSALADLARLEGEPHDREDAFVSAQYAISDLLALKAGPPPAKDLPPEAKADPDGIVVLRAIGGTSQTTSGREVFREFDKLVGKRLPFARVPALAPIRRRLADEFPHLSNELDVLLSGMVEGQPIVWRPTLLVGEPGGGKSRVARRLSEELSVAMRRFDGAGSGDNAFGGTARRWSSGEHSVPLEAVRRGMVANPWVLVDEADKAGTRRDNGRLSDALIPFLERETAARFPDPFVQADVDLSHVGYIVTANDDTVLPAPLRDRLRIVRLPQPRIEHLPQLARSIVADLAKADPLGPEWTAPLDDGELAIAESLWRGGSTRRLAAIVRAIVDRRERQPRN